MRCLVTGGAGFVGSHLVDSLVRRGDDVVVLDDLSTGRLENLEHLLSSPNGNGVAATNGHAATNGDGSVNGNGSLNGRFAANGHRRLNGDRPHPAVEFVEGSTLDEELIDELMSRTDVCFHLASAVGVQLVVDRPLESLIRNVRGADNVCHAAVRRGSRLVFASTSEIYGKNSSDGLSEDSDRLLGAPTTARWGYATSKVFGEMLAYGHHRENGAETMVVRLFNTVGPRQTGSYGMVVPRFVRQALACEDLTVYGDGSQSRCFTHVDDTVAAIVLLMETDRAVGNVYNIGCPTEITILELAERVIERSGSISGIRFIPYEDAYGEGFEELGRRKPDITAVQELTGWSPRLTVDDAIDDVIADRRETEPAMQAS